MNKRQFLKTLAVGIGAALAPFPAVAQKAVPGKWIDVNKLYLVTHPIRVGDSVRVRARQSITFQDLENGMARMVSPYDKYMVTFVDYERGRVKAVGEASNAG